MARLLRLARSEDAAAVRAIYSPLVEETAITFEIEVPAVETMRQRILETTWRFPWIIAEEDGEAVAYAYATSFRQRAAYDWSVESTVYVAPTHRRRGFARGLYRCLLALLELQGIHLVVAGITLPNEESVALHEAEGFRSVGCFHEVGYKLGRWHDVAFYERKLVEQVGEVRPPHPFCELQHHPGVTAILERATADLRPRD